MTSDEKLEALKTNPVRMIIFATLSSEITNALHDAYTSGFCEEELYLMLRSALNNFEKMHKEDGTTMGAIFGLLDRMDD